MYTEDQRLQTLEKDSIVAAASELARLAEILEAVRAVGTQLEVVVDEFVRRVLKGRDVDVVKSFAAVKVLVCVLKAQVQLSRRGVDHFGNMNNRDLIALLTFHLKATYEP